MEPANISVEMNNIFNEISLLYLNTTQITSLNERLELCNRASYLIEEATKRIQRLETQIDALDVNNIDLIHFTDLIKLLDLSKKNDLNYDEVLYIMGQLQKMINDNTKMVTFDEIDSVHFGQHSAII